MAGTVAIVVPGLLVLAGVFLFAAATHLAAGLQRPRDPAHLLFAAMCLLMVPFALSHVRVLGAAGIEEFIAALRWNVAVVLAFFVLFPWFIALYTGARPLIWPGGIAVLFAVLFALNLTSPFGLQYDRLDGIRMLPLPWGEVVTRGIGRGGAAAVAAIAAVLAAFGYALYALGRVYHRNRRGTDLVMMLAMGVLLVAAVAGILVRLAVLDFIEPGPFGFLAMVIAMSVVLKRESARRLRGSERRFRALMEQSPFGIQLLAPDGTLRRVNPAWERLWSMPSQRLAGYNILADRKLIGLGVMPGIRQGFAGEAVEIPPVVYRPEAREPGGNRWLRTYVYPIKDEDGRIADVVVMYEDVTERMRDEAGRIARERVQRDTLIREVHHRVKNNLQGVVGLMRTQADAEPAVRGPLERVMAQVYTMAVVHGLQGKQAGEALTLCELTEAIARGVTGLTGAAVEPVVQRELTRPVVVAPAEGVPVALILNELMFNAVKYHEPAAGEPVRVTIGREDGGICIRVRNRAVPQAGELDFASGRGLGTGLSLVKALVPPQSARLSVRRENHEVVAELHLEPPVVEVRGE